MTDTTDHDLEALGREATPGPLLAHAVYGVVVGHCGANESMRSDFVRAFVAWTPDHFPFEWRFGGDLGGGGKVRYDGRRLYVDCYPEDESPARRDAMAGANVVLAELLATPTASPTERDR